jgi:peroxiredoxin
LQAKGGDIVAISTDPLANLIHGRKRDVHLPCILASDADGTATRTLNLVHESFGKLGKTLAIPANILVDEKGTVLWTHYANIVMDRPAPAKVLAKVLSMSTNEDVLRKK